MNALKRPRFWYFSLDLWSKISWSWTIWSRTTCSWTINNVEEYSKSNIFREHYLNAHCYRSIFGTCSWSSVHFKYDNGVYFDLEYSSRLLMVQDHMVQEQMIQDHMILDHKSRPKSQESQTSLVTAFSCVGS